MWSRYVIKDKKKRSAAYIKCLKCNIYAHEKYHLNICYVVNNAILSEFVLKSLKKPRYIGKCPILLDMCPRIN